MLKSCLWHRTLFQIRVLAMVILILVAAGSLPGCGATGGGEKDRGLRKRGDSVEISVEHQVAAGGLLVKGSRAFIVTEDDGRHAIVELSLTDREERVLVEDAQQTIAVSRDGALLAYGTSADWGEPCEVRLLDPETRKEQKLADTTGPLRGLDFSPDGRSLVFASSEGLVVAGLGGEGKRVLVEGRVGGEETVLQWGPVWSPDGTRIAYAKTYYEGSGPILVVDPQSAAIQAVTGSEDVVCDHTDPRWSPEGKRILYTHSPYDSLDQDRSDAWVADLTGNSPRLEQITPGDGLYRGLGWSPDGRYILIERAASANGSGEAPGKLFAYDTETQELRDLEASSQGRMVATWAEDGYIYYVSPDGRLRRVKP